MSRSKILVAHPWIAHGGSEATTMWTLQALQDDFDVSLVTAADNLNFEQLNDTYHSNVDPGKINVIKAPVLPWVKNELQFVAWQHALFHRFCHTISDDFDLCISGYNIVPFAKPSIQLIGDFSFTEELRKKFYTQSFQSFKHRASLVRSAYLAIRDLISGGEISPGENDIVLANSQWTSKKLEEYVGLKADVIYPPVSLPNQKTNGAKRNELGFLYIGRVSPEKELENIIFLLDKIHQSGFPVTLDIAGNRGESHYEKMISSMAAERVWINDLGYLSGDEKINAFNRNAFGLQACRCEAFGIAAAEMASHGCIPFVPAGCGPAEVVPFRELQFTSMEDAHTKILHLLQTPPLTGHLRQKVIDEAKRFSSEEFVVNLRGIVDSMFGKLNPPPHHSQNVTKDQGSAKNKRSGVLSKTNP